MADELAASSNTLKSTKFNLYVLRVLCDDLQDAVLGILNRHTPPTFTELHGLLFSHDSNGDRFGPPGGRGSNGVPFTIITTTPMPPASIALNSHIHTFSLHNPMPMSHIHHIHI